MLTQDQFKIVLEERAAADLCGYPICHKKKSAVKGKYKISNGNLLPMDQLYFFCSRECLASYRYLLSQMSVEPFHLRKLAKIELLKFKSQSFNQSANQSFNQSANDDGLDQELTIKENTFSMAGLTEALQEDHSAHSAIKHQLKEEDQSRLKIKSLEIKSKKSAESDNESDNQSVPESMQSLGSSEDEEWLAPSKKKIDLKLSLFARTWMYLDRLITSESKLIVNGMKHDESIYLMNSQDVTRLNLASKSIIATYIRIKKNFKINLLLEDDLLALMKSFNYKDFSCVMTNMENWVLTSVFIKALSMNSDQISQEFDGKWEKILERTGLSMDQFNVLCHSF
jgi:hypothetical protein